MILGNKQKEMVDKMTKQQIKQRISELQEKIDLVLASDANPLPSEYYTYKNATDLLIDKLFDCEEKGK